MDSAVETDLSDWDRVRSLSDQDIEQAIRDDPDTFTMEECDLIRLRGTTHRYELYCEASGEWRWVLRSRKGEVLAVSGHAYGTRQEAFKAIEELRLAFIGAQSEAA